MASALPKLILLVDDDADTRQVLGLQLRAEGYRTLGAEDAYTALRLALAHRPDAMVLDLGLPAGGGYHVLARLQEQPVLVGLPVIVISGRHPVEEATRARRAGACAYLRKPIARAVLVAVVRQVLGEG